mgnify:CR=1 FL=1
MSQIQNNLEKIKLNRAIIVEGRDDEAIVSRAVDGMIIVTHGFGISKETWNLIDKADKEKGLIILTDPDHAGEMIRRKISEKYPDALHANIPRNLAKKDGDIGVENAKVCDIQEAIRKVRGLNTSQDKFKIKENSDEKFVPLTAKDLDELGLIGGEGSRAKRTGVCANLGIGYCNADVFLKRVNAFHIGRKELEEALKIE